MPEPPWVAISMKGHVSVSSSRKLLDLINAFGPAIVSPACHRGRSKNPDAPSEKPLHSKPRQSIAEQNAHQCGAQEDDHAVAQGVCYHSAKLSLRQCQTPAELRRLLHALVDLTSVDTTQMRAFDAGTWPVRHNVNHVWLDGMQNGEREDSNPVDPESRVAETL